MTPPAPPALTVAERESLDTLLEQLAQTDGGYAATQYRALEKALAALAAPPPDARLVALVREWREAKHEFEADGENYYPNEAIAEKWEATERALLAFPLPARPTETPNGKD